MPLPLRAPRLPQRESSLLAFLPRERLGFLPRLGRRGRDGDRKRQRVGRGGGGIELGGGAGEGGEDGFEMLWCKHKSVLLSPTAPPKKKKKKKKKASPYVRMYLFIAA